MLAESMPGGVTRRALLHVQASSRHQFHNGKEMTSDDVVASLMRWSKQSIDGKDLFDYVAEGGLRAVDKYTVKLKLKEKVAIVQINLAVANNLAIYPKEIAEKFPAPGEGDQRLRRDGSLQAQPEWKPDQYIRMVRFDDYKSRSGSPPATAAPRPPGLTRFAGFRSRTSPPVSPGWRPASSSWRTT